jgi:tetratricopeptide (TPR) repeat protein
MAARDAGARRAGHAGRVCHRPLNPERHGADACLAEQGPHDVQVQAHPAPPRAATGTADRFARAVELFNAGQAAQAEALCGPIVQAQPAHAQAWQLLGMARMVGGRPADALQPLRQALALQPATPSFFACWAPPPANRPAAGRRGLVPTARWPSSPAAPTSGTTAATRCTR